MFDLSSGTFTAPVKGVYEFSFTGNSDNNNCCSVIVYQNNAIIHAIFGKTCGNEVDKADYANLASTWIVQLNAGDRIRLKVEDGELYTSQYYHRVFNGKILEIL